MFYLINCIILANSNFLNGNQLLSFFTSGVATTSSVFCTHLVRVLQDRSLRKRNSGLCDLYEYPLLLVLYKTAN